MGVEFLNQPKLLIRPLPGLDAPSGQNQGRFTITELGLSSELAIGRATFKTRSPWPDSNPRGVVCTDVQKPQPAQKLQQKGGGGVGKGPVG